MTNLKLLLGIDLADDSQDSLLTILLDYSTLRICSYLGTTELPVTLAWVADEVTVKRYNRLNTEGMVTEGINGVVGKWQPDILAEFLPELDAYKQQTAGLTAQRLVML